MSFKNTIGKLWSGNVTDNVSKEKSNSSTSSDVCRIKRLRILEGLESESAVKLRTLEQVIEKVLADAGGIELYHAFASKKNPQVDFSGSILQLLTVVEVELYNTVIVSKYNGKIPLEVSRADYFDLINSIKATDLPSDIQHCHKDFINRLHTLRNMRNGAAHQRLKTSTKKDFINAYESFCSFYDAYMPSLLTMKKAKAQKEKDKAHFITFSDSTSNMKAVMLTDTYKLGLKYFPVENIKMPDGTLRQPADIILENVLFPYMDFCCRQTAYTLIDLSRLPNYNTKMDWWEIQSILDDACVEMGITSKTPVPLFIIGGDDVIPMAVLPNPQYFSGAEAIKDLPLEMDIDTDLVYAFSTKEIVADTDGQLDIKALGNFNPRFYVSRLPLENNLMATSPENDLMAMCMGTDGLEFLPTAYLSRAIAYGHACGGIEINNPMYVSCASCLNTTYSMVKELPKGKIPFMASPMTKDGIFACPPVQLSNDGFDIMSDSYKEALNMSDMLFFQLHGSQMPGVGYSGQNTDGEPGPTAYTSGMSRISSAKLISGVCCWGARFKNYSRSESILLSQLYNGDTLLFFGASRSVFGCFNPLYNVQGHSVAQELLVIYNRLLFNGYSAGHAAWEAKRICFQNVMRSSNPILPMLALSLMEFNLFGDPTLSVRYEHTQRHYTETPNFPTTTSFFSDFRSYQGKDIYDHIRTLTDNNLNILENKLSEILWQRFGLKPENMVTMRKFGSETHGNEQCSLLYHNPEDNRAVIAYTTYDGEVLGVYSSI